MLFSFVVYFFVCALKNVFVLFTFKWIGIQFKLLIDYVFVVWGFYIFCFISFFWQKKLFEWHENEIRYFLFLVIRISFGVCLYDFGYFQIFYFFRTTFWGSVYFSDLFDSYGWTKMTKNITDQKIKSAFPLTAFNPKWKKKNLLKHLQLQTKGSS